MFKAYLIDPFAEKVSQVKHGGGLGEEDYHNIVKLIEADTIGAVNLKNLDTLYYDDVALYKKRQAPFTIRGFHETLMNKALVVSIHKDRGHDCSPFNSISWYKKNISFPRIAVTRGTEMAMLDENLNVIKDSNQMISEPRVVVRSENDETD